MTGANADAGGTVSYAVYTNNTCTTLAVAGDGISGQPTGGAVTAGSPANSSAVTFSIALSFWWPAAFSTLSLHAALPICVCSSEPLTISPNAPSVATLLSEST